MVNLPDMVVEQARDKDPGEILAAQNFPSGFIEQGIEVLSLAPTMEDLYIQFRRRGFGTDAYQFMLPLFRPLYLEMSEVKETVHKELADTGVPMDLIDAYITSMGDQPHIILPFSPQRGSLPWESLSLLINRAKEVMLSTLRTQLITK